MADRTFLRIQLGRRLVEVRKRAGKTALDAIEAGIVRSKAQMSRLENGYRVQLTLANIAALCDLYGLAGQDKYYLQQMYLKAENDEEWWEPYSEVMFRDISLLFSLERYASRIYIFDNLVNGLFQTERYAEMMHPQGLPDEARKKIALRMNRQADFWSLAEVPQVQLMMPETALLGGCDEEQINLLVERDQLPGISIKYLPASDGPQPYLLGPFTVIGFEGDDPDVVYSENISGARYEDQPVAVEAYLARFTSHFEEQAKPIKEFRRG
ncbi:helix-turn-helix transcriptional regulator [Glycomyces albus]